jgi:hypothetical protein
MSDEQSHSGNGAVDRTGTPATGSAAHTMTCPACSATYAPDTRFCPLDGSVLRPIGSDADDLVGTVLDERYYLVEKLGEGGMGEVYLGEHVLTHRRCAVKVVSRTLAADPEAFGRFVREATNAGRISHPHVATIYDFGKSDEGLLYLAMEYVDGEPLSMLLEREDVLPPARAVEIAQQVAEAVGAAHELGIVHRDLKPGNILVARDRKGADLVKVVDFGIARATADEQQHLTRTGFVIGTPEYMSPEQLIGDPVDERTDIYALGCILYQMLTGTHAFGGSTARLITRRLTERPPRPRELNQAIPKALDEVIVTALGRLPQERYQTMEELRAALLAAPAQPVTTGPRRLASWLGLRDHREPETVVSKTAERAVDATANEPPLPVAADDRTEQAVELLDQAPASGEHEATQLFAEGGAGGAGEAAGEDGLIPSLADATADPPHSSMPRRIAVGGAAGAVLLIALLAFLRPPRSDDVAAPAPVDTMAAVPVPPPAVPDSVLEDVRNELLLVEQENGAEQFEAALGRLRRVESSIATWNAQYPGLVDVQTLADSAQALLQIVLQRCHTARDVALELKEPAPVCDVS